MHIQYKLCSYPSALFDYLDNHKNLVPGIDISEVKYVLGGGSLLQHIPWSRGVTFRGYVKCMLIM